MTPPTGGGFIRCDGGDLSRAEALSGRSGWPLSESDQPLTLWFKSDGLSLEDRAGHWKYQCRFDDGRFAQRRKRASAERLVHAVSLRGQPVRVVDATGGFGRDAVLMASAGCDVCVYERHPIVAAMLRDGLERAGVYAGPSNPLKTIEVREEDAIRALADHQPAPEVVYLDPMFEQTGQAQVRKASQALRRLVGTDGDTEHLLEVALQVATQRVVVKRPIHADPLGSLSPTSILKQRQTRFDLYAVKSASG